MNKFLLFIGAAILAGCVGYRMYLDLTGKWSPYLSHVITCWVVIIGALLFLCGILASAAP